MKNETKGQGLVEFALILPLLLLVVFMIFEAARAFQAYNMLRNSAETAARYAVTGQQEPGSTRLGSIKAQAADAAEGLSISEIEVDGPPYIYYDTPDALIVRVFGGAPTEEDNPGGPGERVLVEVTYNFRLLTPFLADRAPYLRLIGSAEMINEDFGGLRLSQAGAPPLPAPTLAPIPTIGPAPIDIQEPLVHGDLQVRGTGHPSRTIRLTDLDDAGVTMEITVQTDGGFMFDLDSIGERLIGGHTIQVEGLSGYTTSDSALVEPAAPIIITEPLVQGDTTVQGTAHPNETVTLTDPEVPAIDLTTTVAADGTFTFDLSGVAPAGLVADHIIRVEGYAQSDEAPVLDAVPIVIAEPLRPGKTLVQGWAKVGETLTLTDLDDPSWTENGTTAVVDAGGSFFFFLNSGLQGNHRIEVTGYGKSDTAKVGPPPATPTATPMPIAIDEPIYQGDLLVTGRALPGATLRLRDLSDPSRTIDLETTVNADGTFTFDLSSVAPAGLAVDHTLVVQGYGVDAFATVQPPPPSTAYITLGASCQDAVGRTDGGILVKGFNWPLDRGNILFYWDDALLSGLEPSSPNWEKTLYVFVNEGDHTLRVETERSTKTYNASATYSVPCPTIEPTNSPLDLTITQLSVVSTEPFSTHTPLTFNVVVSNPTTYPVNSLFWVDLYVNPTRRPVIARNLRADFSVDYQAVGALAAGSSVVLTMEHTEGVAATGVYSYYALADTFDQVPERDEDNNVSPRLIITVTGVVTVTPTPTPTPTLTPGAPASISGTTYRGSQEQGGTTVILSWTDTGEEVARTQSDPGKGTYQFTGLGPGDYTLEAEYQLGNKLYCASATVEDLQAGEDRGGITLMLYLCG